MKESEAEGIKLEKDYMQATVVRPGGCLGSFSILVFATQLLILTAVR
jgi:hypothetical protein